MPCFGIDFGTTNTVVVMHDRGIFSTIAHPIETDAGQIVQEIFPSSIFIDSEGRRWFGLEAHRRARQAGPNDRGRHIVSLKRQLRHHGQPANDDGTAGLGPGLDLADLLTEFLAALAGSIRSATDMPPDPPLECVITWPAHANGAQRHVTREAFRRAGFDVRGSLSEPTAAAIELADLRRVACGSVGPDTQSRPAAVAVFDLGGGTFDASVVRWEADECRVLASSGIESLGGDDFDELLLGMFLRKLRIRSDGLSPVTRSALRHQARVQKEVIASSSAGSLMLNPGDFGLPQAPVTVSVSNFNRRLRPLLEPAVRVLQEVLADAIRQDSSLRRADAVVVYLVGGSSRLPLVGRMVADALPGRTVVHSDKPFRAVARGAAICAAEQVRFGEIFARHFGVIRLEDHGRAERFDPIFSSGTPLPRHGQSPLVKTARYRPAHNIGRLRYLECSALSSDRLPVGDRREWPEILFPYDPDLPLGQEPPTGPIICTDAFGGEEVREVYRCDADGVITVELQRPGTREACCHEICQRPFGLT